MSGRVTDVTLAGTVEYVHIVGARALHASLAVAFVVLDETTAAHHTGLSIHWKKQNGLTEVKEVPLHC